MRLGSRNHLPVCASTADATAELLRLMLQERLSPAAVRAVQRLHATLVEPNDVPASAVTDLHRTIDHASHLFSMYRRLAVQWSHRTSDDGDDVARPPFPPAPVRMPSRAVLVLVLDLMSLAAGHAAQADDGIVRVWLERPIDGSLLLCIHGGSINHGLDVGDNADEPSLASSIAHAHGLELSRLRLRLGTTFVCRFPPAPAREQPILGDPPLRDILVAGEGHFQQLAKAFIWPGTRVHPLDKRHAGPLAGMADCVLIDLASCPGSHIQHLFTTRSEPIVLVGLEPHPGSAAPDRPYRYLRHPFTRPVLRQALLLASRVNLAMEDTLP